ncbi:MAG: hypothetical protein GY822_18440 [Deltaproteobacteria bacterium]|nr:hypothetical protein [Deltaproteobacteria bacterium]
MIQRQKTAAHRHVSTLAFLGMLTLSFFSNAQPSSSAKLNVTEKSAVEKKMQAAEKALHKNDVDKTLLELQETTQLLRRKASLHLPKVVVVHGVVKGLGDYYPAKDGVLSSRLLRLYVEVENFVWQERSHSNGELLKAKLDVTGVFFEGDGTEIGKKPLGKRTLKTRTQHGRTYFGLEVQLGEKIPAGQYQLEIQVTDLVGKKTATKRVAFVIR